MNEFLINSQNEFDQTFLDDYFNDINNEIFLIMNRKTFKFSQNRDENVVYFSNVQSIQHVQ